MDVLNESLPSSSVKLAPGFKFFLKDWESLFRLILNTIHFEKDKLILKHHDSSKINALNELFSIFDLNNVVILREQLDSGNNGKILSLELPCEIDIPEWDWQTFRSKVVISMNKIFSFQSFFPDLVPLMRMFLAGVSRNVRVIGSETHPLKQFLDKISNPNLSLELLITSYQKWINSSAGKIWATTNQPESVLNLPYALLIHLYRQPIANNMLILCYLYENYLVERNRLSLNAQLEKETYFITTIPLLLPKYRQLQVIQCLRIEKDLLILERYWRYYAANILRTLAYVASKKLLLQVGIKNILEQKLRNNTEKYIESCLNPSVVSAFKEYQAYMSDIQMNEIKTYSEFYILYRGGILEKRLKSAEEEYKNNPKYKIYKKRVNRRRRRLMDFLEDFLDVYGFVALEGLVLYKIPLKALVDQKTELNMDNEVQLKLESYKENKKIEYQQIFEYLKFGVTKEFNLVLQVDRNLINTLSPELKIWLKTIYKNELKNIILSKWKNKFEQLSKLDKKIQETIVSSFLKELSSQLSRRWESKLVEDINIELRTRLLEKFIGTDKLYNDIKSKWIQRDKYAYSSTDPLDFPMIFLHDDWEKENAGWIYKTHLLSGFPGGRLLSFVTIKNTSVV